jgi:hypothetical protein
MTLLPDQDQLEKFIRATFKHAKAGKWISLRSFYEDQSKPFEIKAIKLNGDIDAVVKRACEVAERAANAKIKVVFAPPVATFNTAVHARQKDLAEGVVLSVECDQHPKAARVKLEQLLGPATLVIASGGTWTNPETGETELKLHLHWRLQAPASGKDLTLLKQLRRFATELVGGDPSNVPAVHPLRWPGSWRRKGKPKLCTIVANSPRREIELSDALEKLQTAVTAKSTEASAHFERVADEQITGPSAAWSDLLEDVFSSESFHASLLRLAAKLISSGMNSGAAVNLLRDWMQTSISLHDARWQARYDDIPRAVKTAEGKGYAPAPGTSDTKRAWPKLAPEALYGLAGEVVRLYEPHTEADPVALLLQFHTYFGSAIDRTTYYLVEADEHHGNLYVVLVGDSSKSRKGTSAGRMQQLMAYVDEIWIEECIKGGLSSGEGVIEQIHDDIIKNGKDGPVVTSAAVPDKRLMVDEREFAQALAVMRREGSTLSAILRNGWDGRSLQTMVKNNPLRCARPHIAVCGHITQTELMRDMDDTTIANGFANRFLFACVRRSKSLPFGSSPETDAVKALAEKIKAARDRVYLVDKQITMDPGAREMWGDIYEELSSGKPGLFGAITGRAEAQTVRLALLYALQDSSDQIKVEHLKAGLALWKYCEDSCAYIFGDAIGDHVADEILRALKNNRELTRTQIRDLFGRNQNADKIGAALGELVKWNRIRCEMRTSGGRPIEIWSLKV